ncbi:MAG TPA: nucleotidyltransferase domain-containing protein [Oscillatoriaceae cyanobacterium]
MTTSELKRDELRATILCQPTQVLFASACGPLLYGLPHRRGYVELRGVHADASDPQPTREWRGTAVGGQIEWASHEVGKFVRLLQLNQGSAYEQLFSPHVVYETAHLAELRAIAARMLSLQLVQYYRELFATQRGFLSPRERHARRLLYLYRVALTGIHLKEARELVTDLGVLARFHERVSVMQLLHEPEAEVADWRPYHRELDALQRRLNDTDNRAALPDLVPHRDAADAWLAAFRAQALSSHR